MKRSSISLIVRERKIKTKGGVASRLLEWLSLRRPAITSVGVDVEKRGAWEHCQWKWKLVQPLWKPEWRFLKKWKLEPPYDPAIPPLGICPKEIKSSSQRESYTPMFAAALFTITNMWTQPECPSTGKWTEVVVYTYNGIRLSQKKEQNWVIYSHVDGPRICHTEWSKSEREKEIQILMHMCRM